MKYIFGKIKSVKKFYSECKEILQLGGRNLLLLSRKLRHNFYVMILQRKNKSHFCFYKNFHD